jgi:hypothetical protein
MVERGGPSDMFGPLLPRRKRARGWTELDRIRTRYAKLSQLVADGEANERQMEEASRLRILIIDRENEARVKWAKSFGK